MPSEPKTENWFWVVAIGKPGEDLPTPGAARIYVSDEEWKEEVKRRMRAARLVVIRAGVAVKVNGMSPVLLARPIQAAQKAHDEPEE